MSSLDRLARDAGAEVRDQVATIEPPTAAAIVRRSRRGRVATGVAAVAVLALAGVGLAVALQDDPTPNGLQVTDDSESTTVPGVPVWYDARGLHHGDVVEQTPVELMPRDGEAFWGALALVRSGAVYLDPATGDVWFHPWGGEPRIVGHNSNVGPGGDPNGDTAAWFEGTELVVYDTAASREISRTEQPAHRIAGGPLAGRGEHYPPGNGFLQVSPERVVWTTFPEGTRSYDLSKGRTSPLEDGLLDVHDQVGVLGDDPSVVLRVPGRAEERYPDAGAQSPAEPQRQLRPWGRGHRRASRRGDRRHQDR